MGPKDNPPLSKSRKGDHGQTSRLQRPASQFPPNTSAQARLPDYDVIEYFDKVDKMMEDARKAEAAAKLPKKPAVEERPPPDYETDEYFSKIDATMAKIANGTIDDHTGDRKKKRSKITSKRGGVNHMAQAGLVLGAVARPGQPCDRN
ncbi:unnamed protein product [Discula destructiva]